MANLARSALKQLCARADLVQHDVDHRPSRVVLVQRGVHAGERLLVLPRADGGLAIPTSRTAMADGAHVRIVRQPGVEWSFNVVEGFRDGREALRMLY